jgi:predicted dehydrogenase
MPSLPTRRAVLQLPVLAAPAIGAMQSSPNDTVHVAFIGVGNRGGYLLTQMLQVPGIRVVAIADIAPETLAAAGRVAESSGHKAALYTDYRKMLDEHKEIDAVIIATPVNTHKDIAIATLEVGKHVYCEKPMALSPEECRMVATAAKSAKGIFQTGFQLRHDPARHASVEFIRAGGMGRILYLQGFRHTGDLPRNTPWYFDRTISGDNIVEQACHILDLFTWAVDKPPLRAYGSGGINLYKDVPSGRTTMDNYSVIYEYPNDIRLNFSHIYFDPPGFSGIHERVWCENGAIELATATWIPREKKEEIKLDVPNAGQKADYLSLAAFIDNARGRKTPLNNAESARRSTLVAMLGRKAIYERRIVEWSEVDI